MRSPMRTLPGTRTPRNAAFFVAVLLFAVAFTGCGLLGTVHGGRGGAGLGNRAEELSARHEPQLDEHDHLCDSRFGAHQTPVREQHANGFGVHSTKPAHRRRLPTHGRSRGLDLPLPQQQDLPPSRANGLVDIGEPAGAVEPLGLLSEPMPDGIGLDHAHTFGETSTPWTFRFGSTTSRRPIRGPLFRASTRHPRGRQECTRGREGVSRTGSIRMTRTVREIRPGAAEARDAAGSHHHVETKHVGGAPCRRGLRLEASQLRPMGKRRRTS